MRVLLCPMGSAGDVFPFLGIGEQLMKLGYEVSLYTTDYFLPRCTALGMPFHRLGPCGVYQASIEDPRLWHPTKSFAYLYETMCKPILEEQFAFVSAWCEQPDSIVFVNCFGFGALCAADAKAARVVSLHLQPSVLASLADPPALPNVSGPKWLRRFLLKLGGRIAIDPVVCPSLNAFRQSKGLAPIRDVMHWWNSKELNFLLFPEWFAKPAVDWPRPYIQLGFPLWEAGSQQALPPDLQRFLQSGSPPVAITAGSANVHAKSFFAMATKACESLGLRTLYLSARDDQLPHPLSSDSFACPFVPLQKILPRCAMMINHGGIGTVSQAITAGIPQIVVALAHDQFGSAERIVKNKLGLGMRRTHCNAKRLAKGLAQVLQSTPIQESCRKASVVAKQQAGVVHAARIIHEAISQ